MSLLTGHSISAQKGKHKTGALLVYERLRERILNLSLEPGSLLDEHGLAAEFGISRSPVREALIRLSVNGLVTTLPNRSSIVAPLNFRQISALLQSLDLAYRTTCRSAARYCRPDDIARLREIEDRRRLLRAKGSTQARIDINHEFHMAVAEIGRNDYLSWFLERLLEHGQRLMHTSAYFASGSSRPGSQSAHKQIITALKNGDADAAEEAARLDVEFLKTQVLREFSTGAS